MLSVFTTMTIIIKSHCMFSFKVITPENFAYDTTVESSSVLYLQNHFKGLCYYSQQMPYPY